MKKIIFGFIGIIGSVLFTVLLLEIALQILPVRSYIPMEPVTLEDPVLRYKPNVDQTYAAAWNFTAQNKSSTNAQGYLADFDFVQEDPKPLIAVVGDSYVEARMVPFKDTMQEKIHDAVRDTHRVYGVGVGGSPLSQYLIFAKMMQEKYKPGFMVVNVVDNDFDESMPRYKNMPRFHYFMPMADGTFLPLLIGQYAPGAVKELLSRSALVRYLYFHLNFADVANKIQFRKRGGSESPAIDDVAAVVQDFNTRLAFSKLAVDSFLSLLPRYSGLPTDRLVLVIDGQRSYIYHNADTGTEAQTSYFGEMRTYFMEQARARGYEVIDMHPVFKTDYAERSQRFDYPGDAHWNSLGHGLAAAEILQSHNLKAYLGQ